MENFTPYSSLIGGLMIGAATVLMLWTSGRIAGISGILGGLLFRVSGDALWRALFIAGMLLAIPLYSLLVAKPVVIDIQAGPFLTIAAGLLVGIGSRMGSGCTSGHGICGISRFSKRSFAATATFIGTGVLTVFLLRHVIGIGS